MPGRPTRSKWWKRIGWLFAGLIGSLVLFHVVENYRGAKALGEAIRRAEAAGETLEFDDLILEPVPDDENFGAIPLLKNIAVVTGNDEEAGPGGEARQRIASIEKRVWPLRGAAPDLPVIPLESGQKMSLDEFPPYFREKTELTFVTEPDAAAGDVILAALGEFEAVFGELEAAIDLPYARFSPGLEQYRGNGNLFAVQNPQYQEMLKLSKLVSLRSHALIESGDAAGAADSLLVGLRLSEMSGNEGFLIGLLVSIAQLNIVDRPLWAALESRLLTEEDLKLIQRRVGRQDVLDGYLDGMRMEMAVLHGTMEFLEQDGRRAGYLERFVGAAPGLPVVTASSLCPHGWVRQNHARLIDHYLLDCIVPAKNARLGVLKQSVEKAGHELEEMRGSWNPYTILMRISAPALVPIVRKVAEAKVEIDQIWLACALERYFIAEGKYPSELAGLVPRYVDAVPEDVMGDGALKYLLTDDGRYRIYSVGWDGFDDRGEVVLKEDGRQDVEFGDWVWGYDPGAKAVSR